MAIVLSGPKPSQRELEPFEEIDEDVSSARFIGVSWEDRGQVWMRDGDSLKRPGVPRFEPISISAHGDVRSAILSQVGRAQKVVLHSMRLDPGQYYPRIARPIDQHPTDLPSRPGFQPSSMQVKSEIYSAARYFSSLMKELDVILDTVEPSAANYSSYGNRTRNLLMLACTECENQMRGVLHANGVEAERYTTKHFVELMRPMRLDEYRVAFSEMPWLDHVSPFRGWDSEKPTKSLEWYDAYNAAKHDRAQNGHRASLKTVFQSLAGLWVLLAAQYGPKSWRTISGSERTFSLISAARWRFSDVYVYPYDGADPEVGPVCYFS